MPYRVASETWCVGCVRTTLSGEACCDRGGGGLILLRPFPCDGLTTSRNNKTDLDTCYRGGGSHFLARPLHLRSCILLLCYSYTITLLLYYPTRNHLSYCKVNPKKVQPDENAHALGFYKTHAKIWILPTIWGFSHFQFRKLL